VKICRSCKKPIQLTPTGMKFFCSRECRDEYRKTYYRNHKRVQRLKYPVHNSSGYGNTYLPDVHSVTPEKSSTYEAENQGLGPFEGMSWEDLKIAKECCNFEAKKREGYCITLHEPYHAFKVKCVECLLFQALKDYQLKNSPFKRQ
jgi:hypothetical protein